MKPQSKPRIITPFIIKGAPQTVNPYIFKNGGCASDTQFLLINSKACSEKTEISPNDDNQEDYI